MIKFAGKCVAKFIPIPRDERRKEILRILNKIEKYAKRKEDYEKLSKRAKQRLEWIKKAKEWRNVRKVCRYYGISPATFYKWKKRYEIFGLVGLEDRDKTPKNKRQPEITREQEIRIIKLRKQYIRYGKEKLAVLYERIYGEKISSWKIYRVIRKYDLYWN
ncbi:MAG: helix-turn-helix domain-containing protein, partial [Candidatus Omnitrophica bacterium]|nr:helix-turn-helix domain-containing protein [Candidatus Omnitrophota bacterium]